MDIRNYLRKNMEVYKTAQSMNIMTSFAIGEVVYKLYNGEIEKGIVSRIDLRVGLYSSNTPNEEPTLTEILYFYNENSGCTTNMNNNKGLIFRNKKDAANHMLKEAGFECGLDDLK